MIKGAYDQVKDYLRNLVDQEDAQITTLTAKLVDVFVKLSPRVPKQKVEEISAIKDVKQKAITTFQEAIILALGDGSAKYCLETETDFLKDVSELMTLSETIKNGIRNWSLVKGYNAVFYVMRIFRNNLADVKKFTEAIGEDLVEQKNDSGNIPLTELSWHRFAEAMSTYYNEPKYFALTKQWWIDNLPEEHGFIYEENLFSCFEWTEQDRNNLEKTTNDRGYFKLNETKLWIMLAKKFPREGDNILKLKVYMQRKDERHLVQLLLAHESKNVDIRLLIPEPPWPGYFWPLSFSAKIGDYIISMLRRVPVHEVDYFLQLKIVEIFSPDLKQFLLARTATPKWVLEGYANQIVPNTNSREFFSLANRRNAAWNQYDTMSNTSFNFEELPGDIIYCIVCVMSYKQIISLALTNKRIRHLVMKSEYIANYLSRKYFTGMKISAANLVKKMRFREYKHTLVGSNNLWSGTLKSIELTEEDLLIATKSGPNLYLSWYKIDDSDVGISYHGGSHWNAEERFSARVYQGQVLYAVHGSKISVVKPKEFSLVPSHEVTSSLINLSCGYFHLLQNSLIGCGYWMDLTTNQIQHCPSTTDLSTIQMHGPDAHTGYGIDLTHSAITHFDTRATAVSTTQRLQVKDGVVHNFAWRDDTDAIYVVARHVSEWDRRALHSPVRMSTDVNVAYNKQWGYYRPAIDLTSMKVVCREQIWDLADFTWKFNRSIHHPVRIFTNGALCVYQTHHVLNICRTGLNSYSSDDFYCSRWDQLP